MAFTITRGKTFANNETLTPTKLNQAGVPTLVQAEGTLLGRAAGAGAGATSELSASQGRTVLGLGDAAQKNTGTTAGTVCAGDDSRLTNSRQCNNSFDSAATARTNLGFDSLATVTYAASVALDLAAREDLKTIALTGNLSLTTTNRAAGRSYVLRLVGDGSTRTLTFSSSWVFVTDKPTQLAAGKTAILVLQCYGTAETDIVASYAVQS